MAPHRSSRHGKAGSPAAPEEDDGSVHVLTDLHLRTALPDLPDVDLSEEDDFSEDLEPTVLEGTPVVGSEAAAPSPAAAPPPAAVPARPDSTNPAVVRRMWRARVDKADP